MLSLGIRCDDLLDQIMKLHGGDCLHLRRLVRLADRVPDLLRVKGHLRAVAFLIVSG